MNKTEVKLNGITVQVKTDLDPDISYLQQPEFKDRLEEYENGEFEFVGVGAVATIIDSNSTIQEISSGFVWGVESDGDTDYMDEIKNEQIEILKSTLIGDFGFTEAEVEAIEIEDA